MRLPCIEAKTETLAFSETFLKHLCAGAGRCVRSEGLGVACAISAHKRRKAPRFASGRLGLRSGADADKMVHAAGYHPYAQADFDHLKHF